MSSFKKKAKTTILVGARVVRTEAEFVWKKIFLGWIQENNLKQTWLQQFVWINSCYLLSEESTQNEIMSIIGRNK